MTTQQTDQSYNAGEPLVHDLMITGYIRKISHHDQQQYPLDIVKLIAIFASLCDCWDEMNSSDHFKISQQNSFLELGAVQIPRGIISHYSMAFGVLTIEKGQKMVWNIKLLKGASNIMIGIIPFESIYKLLPNETCFKTDRFGAIGLDIDSGYIYNNSNKWQIYAESGWESDIITMELDMSKDNKKHKGSNKTTKKCILKYMINNKDYGICCKVNKLKRYKLAISMNSRSCNNYAVKIIDDTSFINQTFTSVW